MMLPAHIDFGNAEFISRFAQINLAGGLYVRRASAYDKRGDKYIRGVKIFHGYVNDRIFTGNGFDPGLQNPFAFHGDQCGGFAKRHPYLEDGFITRFVSFFLRDQIDPVIIADVKPPFVFIRHPDIPVGDGFAPCFIGAFGL